MRKRINCTRTTARLVRGARTGDADAFRTLFGRVAVRLLLDIQFRLAHTGTESNEPVEILRAVHGIGYRVFRRHVYKDADSFLSWLRGIADRRIEAVLAI